MQRTPARAVEVAVGLGDRRGLFEVRVFRKERRTRLPMALVSETVEERDESDLVLSAERGQLAGLLLPEDPFRAKLGMGLKLEAVVDLEDDDIDAHGDEGRLDGPFERASVGGAPDLHVNGAPELGPRGRGGGALCGDRRRSSHKNEEDQQHTKPAGLHSAPLLPLEKKTASLGKYIHSGRRLHHFSTKDPSWFNRREGIPENSEGDPLPRVHEIAVTSGENRKLF